MSGSQGQTSLLQKASSRRAVLGGTIAAASLAVTYAALGDKLDLFGGSSAGPRADSDAIKDESVRISHLLRRAGFGVTHEEHEYYQSLGLDATIDGLVNFTAVDDGEAEGLANQVQAENLQGLSAWWLVRMANTRRPLQEKLTFFWHGLLTSQFSVVRSAQLMQRQNEFFRANAMARFPDILKGVSMDPSMMLYLDINNSQRRAPNENYARELMELFALGIGNYTEQDVREAARAFTGWQVPRTRIGQNDFSFSEPVFRPNLFDDGNKTVLGKTGNFRPEDIVDIIVQQPASASFIVGKLFSFFVYSGADMQTLQPFVDVYVKSDMNIGATVEAILRSDEMYSAKAYRAIIRSPIEYAVATIKALGSQANVVSLLGQGRGQIVSQMGQVLFEPPNVAGWPGGETWVNSATMFSRLNFINQMTGGLPAPRNARDRLPPSQPSLGANPGTAAQALDYYLPLVLDANIPDEARRVLVDYAGGPDAALSEQQLRSLVYLILASPQFHLA